MARLTKAQQIALLNVYNRPLDDTDCPHCGAPRKRKAAPTYLQFRRRAQTGSFGCIMIEWTGMWLGIEQDGYTHS